MRPPRPEIGWVMHPHTYIYSPIHVQLSTERDATQELGACVYVSVYERVYV